jgi:cytochrome b involved in lipid metabolism
VLLNVNGKDGTNAFARAGHSQNARNLMKSMIIGKIPDKQGAKSISAATKTVVNVA